MERRSRERSRPEMLSVISSALFLTADLFAIFSLAIPKWIVSDVAGETHVGLLSSCLTVYGRDTECYTPDPQPAEWRLTFALIVLAILFNTVTVILLIISFMYKREATKLARWTGFVSMLFFCLAAVVFPAAFDMDDIGGLPYQLPSSFRIGLSYILFMLSLWLTVISELFVGNVCLPHF